MSSDRSSIKERLRRLLSMTVENGATEAEAMLASEKAAALMAEHNLSYRTVDEIEVEAFADDSRAWFRGSKGRQKCAPVPPAARCLDAICKLCTVEHLFNTYNGELTFFGAAHDTEVAHYLVIIISRAMDREWIAYRARMRPDQARRARSSFYYGISHRIAQRLNEMGEQQRSQPGTGLVLLKDALVKERFAQRHRGVKDHRGGAAARSIEAVKAGWNAGAEVPLNRAVTEASGAKLITADTTEVPA